MRSLSKISNPSIRGDYFFFFPGGVLGERAAYIENYNLPGGTANFVTVVILLITVKYIEIYRNKS